MPEMKDSGIDWVGKIPKDWNTTKIKYNFDIINGYSFQSSLYSDDGIRVIRISDVEDDYLSDKNVRYYPDSFAKSLGTAMLKKDDILVTLTGYVGKCYQLSEKDTNLGLNQRVGALRSITNNYNVSYMRRVIQCESFRKKMELNAKGSAQLNMSTEWFKNNTVPCPSILEQTRIAAFLESKCSEIDALRSDIEKEIETLEEYKKSIISETVTKGLDKNVEMKDSGIDWVGEIPKNWDIYKNKMLLSSIYSGGTPTSSNPEYYDVDGIPFITIADMSQTDYVSTTKIGLTKKGILNKNLKILPPGTILYSIYATLGAVSETTIPATINQAILALTPKEEICYKKYYKYNLIALKDYIFSLSNKTTQSNLNAEIVKNLNIVVPPFDIQKKIADYLDSKCSDIDSIIEDKKKQLKILDTHKKSIIYEYVTGKKEVSA